MDSWTLLYSDHIKFRHVSVSFNLMHKPTLRDVAHKLEILDLYYMVR